MDPIEQSIRAAEGWFELGNIAEAAEALHNLPPAAKSSVEVVRLWVRIYAAQKAWPSVEMIAETLLKHAPTDPVGVLNMAEALHRQGQTGKGFKLLHAVPKDFKKTWEFYYLMARLLCSLGHRTTALTTLGMAIDRNPQIRMKALLDPELEAVWVDLQEG